MRSRGASSRRLRRPGLWNDALVGERHAWFFAVLELLKPRVKKLDDIVEVGRFFFVDLPEYDAAAVEKHLRPEGIAGRLRALDAAFGALADVRFRVDRGRAAYGGRRHWCESGYFDSCRACRGHGQNGESRAVRRAGRCSAVSGHERAWRPRCG